MKTEIGFFVKFGDASYSTPFLTLKEARAEARKNGPDLQIYHGTLQRINDEIIDDTLLFLIPKVQKI